MLLETRMLSKIFRSAKGNSVHAVKEANLYLYEGETVGLLGESGSGKSTLGQLIVGQQKPSSGEIFYKGEQLRHPYKGVPRREIQILYQHPEVSFNPQLRLITSLAEPYKFHRLPFSREILLQETERLGLYDEHLNRYPSELSGGELQRAALARILTLRPKLIILDEPTSMLDVISQAQVVSILRDIQAETGTGYLFITHNEALCYALCNRIYNINDGVLTSREKEQATNHVEPSLRSS